MEKKKSKTATTKQEKSLRHTYVSLRRRKHIRAYVVLTFPYVVVSSRTQDVKKKSKTATTKQEKSLRHAYVALRRRNHARAYVVLTFPYVDVSSSELTSCLRFLT